jgi:replication factor C subunit 1
MVMPRIMAIAKKEGLELGINTVEELVASTQGDIRQILTLLSTYRLTSDSMNYDQSKFLGGGSKKDVDHGPFDAVPNLLGGTFDRMSLGEKIDQYFVDSSLVPLMVQENYLRAKSTTPRMIRGKATGHSYIDLCSAAADSISDADLVDSLIRGSNQEWSLSPFHAVMSSVRPAYYCHGAMSGRVEFASWLGQNSKQTKNWRLLGEITKHAYLKTATGKSEMRMSYAPVLAERLLRPLILEGVEGIDKTIELMDSYTLAREDVDSILDLVLDKRIGSEAYSKIPTTVKTTFTRRYNSGSHKLPYAIGGTAMAVKKITEVDMPAGGGGDDDEELTLMADNGDEAEGEEDIGKDKMIKAKTVKGRGRGRGK